MNAHPKVQVDYMQKDSDTYGDQCGDEHCITCGDIATEARIIEVLADNFARVVVNRREEIVSIALVDAVPGDILLVHAGEAIARLEQYPERPLSASYEVR